MTCFPKKGVPGEKSQGTLDPRSISPCAGLSPYFSRKNKKKVMLYVPCKPQRSRFCLGSHPYPSRTSSLSGFYNPEMHARKEHFLALRPEGRAGQGGVGQASHTRHIINVTDRGTQGLPSGVAQSSRSESRTNEFDSRQTAKFSISARETRGLGIPSQARKWRVDGRPKRFMAQ